MPETERKNTDDSLDNERSTTNESLKNGRQDTEHTTDELVHAERARADEELRSSRIQTDKNRDSKSDPMSAKANGADGAGQLDEERQRADQATERERERTDELVDKERELKKALNTQFLEKEREFTDENLSIERERTDSEFDQATSMLSAEVADHLKTLTSLTTIEEFLAIVSHDLKNPIAAVSSCADLLLETRSDNIDPEIRSWIEFLKRNADTSLRLISDLLDMERIVEGKLQLSFVRYDIGKIIRETVETHALLASEKSISLNITSTEQSCDVLCDRDRIFQMLSNLISNAIKFTPEGGAITVCAEVQESEVQIRVRDNGPGIADDKVDHIFERFMQLGFHDRLGLGLGLHIAKMLVEAHQGRIWVQSKLGEGSTFYIALPILRSKAETS